MAGWLNWKFKANEKKLNLLEKHVFKGGQSDADGVDTETVLLAGQPLEEDRELRRGDDR